MILHGGYIKRAKTAKKWRRKNGRGVQLDPPPSLLRVNYIILYNSKWIKNQNYYDKKII